MGSVLLDTVDARSICDRAVRVMVDDLGAVNCSIMLLTPDGRALRVAAACGRDDRDLSDAERASRFERAREIPLGEGIAGQVAVSGRPRFVADVQADDAFKVMSTAVEVRSLYCFPLRGRDELMGVINLSHPHLDEAATSLRRILHLFAASVGQALTVARLHRRVLEEERERHTKLAAMGEMAATVAHEINNPLTNILLRAQRLQRGARTPEQIEKLSAQIEREVERISKITTKLLQVGPERDDAPRAEALASVVEDTLILTEHHLRTRRAIDVTTELDPDLPSVVVVRHELEQVFTNLITNAARAMPDGGRLVIRATTVAGAVDLPVGRYVAVSFADSGCGIPEENRARIFDAFFTTGERIGGSGLGLPISREIVERFGGRITVDSEPGAGSTFTVTLPAADG